MLSASETTAVAAALAAARSTLDGIERAYASWRNALSYLGTWAEDDATRRARERTEAARAEFASLERERDELAGTPVLDHEAALFLVERARRFAVSDAARVTEAEGRGSNWSAIVASGARQAIDGAGNVVEAAADEAADELGDVARRLPWWVWAIGAVVALAALAPLLTTVAAVAARGRK